jgi:uncharacterized protein YpmB
MRKKQAIFLIIVFILLASLIVEISLILEEIWKKQEIKVL